MSLLAFSNRAKLFLGICVLFNAIELSNAADDYSTAMEVLSVKGRKGNKNIKLNGCVTIRGLTSENEVVRTDTELSDARRILDAQGKPVLLLAIDLADTNVTDTKLRKIIARVPNLEFLHLGDAMNITDSGLANISTLKKLKNLEINGNTNVTNALVGSLLQCTELTLLNFNGCKKITDDCFDDLCEIKSLIDLDIVGTQMASDAKTVDELFEFLPNLMVVKSNSGKRERPKKE